MTNNFKKKPEEISKKEEVMMEKETRDLSDALSATLSKMAGNKIPLDNVLSVLASLFSRNLAVFKLTMEEAGEEFDEKTLLRLLHKITKKEYEAMRTNEKFMASLRNGVTIKTRER